MKAKKIGIVPDIHQDFEFANNSLEYLLEIERVDKVIFLGDYFDSFYDPPRVYSFKDSCEALIYLVEKHPRKDDFVFLVGNHDMKYIYENKTSPTRRDPQYYCSGFTLSKANKFKRKFVENGRGDEWFQRHFKPFHQEGGYTFSHAGISDCLYKGNRYILENINSAWNYFRDNNHHWHPLLAGVGYARGGHADHGGILWCDFNREFKPCKAIGKQIVGHTTLKEGPRSIMETPEDETWCLDSLQRYVGVLEDGEVKQVKLDSAFPSIDFLVNMAGPFTL